MKTPTPCPRCGEKQLQIQQAEDGFERDIFCCACGWKMPLKQFNKKLPF